MTAEVASSLSPSPGTPRDLAAISTERWHAVLNGEPSQAMAWMTSAARLGHAEAQAVLGQWLLDGHGAPRDEVQALHWFLSAAHRGHAMAMNMAGRCHEQGWGAAVDASKAAHWYRQAARLALPEARYNLANLLASGDGVTKDHREACALYRAAADQGYAKAYAKLGRYHEDGLVVDRDPAEALRCYRLGAEGGDFRGQFCYAGMLAAQGHQREALAWLGKVLESPLATPRYLLQAGALLQQAPDPALQAIGQRMIERGSALNN